MGSAPIDRGPAKPTDFNMWFVAETFKKNDHFFFEKHISGDEKWIVYNNIKRKRSWEYLSEPPKVIPKAGLHLKRVLLSTGWHWQRILFFELIPSKTTINSDVYCDKLEKLKTTVQQKRPSLANQKGILQHVNARPHTSLKTRRKLLELNWEVLPHLPYSL